MAVAQADRLNARMASKVCLIIGLLFGRLEQIYSNFCDAEEWHLSNHFMFQFVPWIVISLLQKVIRRGEDGQALRASSYLYQMDYRVIGWYYQLLPRHFIERVRFSLSN